MRVLYVLHDINSFAGASKALCGIINQLKKYDVIPIVAAPGKSGIIEKLIRQNIEVIDLPIRYSTYPRIRSISEWFIYPFKLIKWLSFNMYSEYKLIKIVKEKKIDIIHSNSSVISVGLNVAHKAKIPHVMHFREYGYKDFGFHYFPTNKKYHDKIKRYKSHIISITKDINSHHKIGDEGVVIYDGIFPREVKKPQFSLGDYFLYAGRIEPAKGLLDLLKAYKKYKGMVDNPLILKVAGSHSPTSYYKEIIDYIKHNLLTENVIFLGQSNNMPGLYKNARCLIVPSICEGFGFCMPEAMYNGCIVVGHNTGGTKEQFDNGFSLCQKEIGFRYDTVDDLSKKLLFMHNVKEEEIIEIKNDAFWTVNRLYTFESCTEQIVRFYKKIKYETEKDD